MQPPKASARTFALRKGIYPIMDSSARVDAELRAIGASWVIVYSPHAPDIDAAVARELARWMCRVSGEPEDASTIQQLASTWL